MSEQIDLNRHFAERLFHGRSILIFFRFNEGFNQRISRLSVERQGVFQRLQFQGFLEIIPFQTLTRCMKELFQIFETSIENLTLFLS